MNNYTNKDKGDELWAYVVLLVVIVDESLLPYPIFYGYVCHGIVHGTVLYQCVYYCIAFWRCLQYSVDWQYTFLFSIPIILIIFQR